MAVARSVRVTRANGAEYVKPGVHASGSVAPNEWAVDLNLQVMSRLSVREICEAAVVQLVSNSDCAGWAISMLCQNEVRFAGSWVISLKRIGPVQEYYHIRVLFN